MTYASLDDLRCLLEVKPFVVDVHVGDDEHANVVGT